MPLLTNVNKAPNLSTKVRKIVETTKEKALKIKENRNFLTILKERLIAVQMTVKRSFFFPALNEFERTGEVAKKQ